MILRKILFILAIISISFGIYSTYSTILFIRKAQKVDATVLGYSSFQTDKRIAGDCSAFRKDCAVSLKYNLNGQEVKTDVYQPLFTRAKSDVITLLVDPNDPSHPQMASLHVLLRNATSTTFLGIVALFIGWLIGKEKKG